MVLNLCSIHHDLNPYFSLWNQECRILGDRSLIDQKQILVLTDFNNMLHLRIFTDGSVNTQLKVGYGAYLVVSDINASIDLLKDIVKVRRFEQTSSTKLELQIVLWSLEEVMVMANENDITLTVYTDSQNIVGLPGRRARLEQSNYYSGKNRRLNNYELYQKFYRLTAKLNCAFVKVAGHQVSSKKDAIDRIFSLADRASRHALRKDS